MDWESNLVEPNKTFIQKIKKNTQLSRSEKREMIEFWGKYKCPVAMSLILRATYHDGEVKEYTAANRIEHFYDETPDFIERFFGAMSRGEDFNTRFAHYKPLPVS